MQAACYEIPSEGLKTTRSDLCPVCANGGPQPPLAICNASAIPKTPIKAATGSDLRPFLVFFFGGGGATHSSTSPVFL